MTSRTKLEQGLGWLYDATFSEEDARVCKDIPDSACNDQPRNFYAYLVANFLNKTADELVSARIILPWLFSILAVPAVLIGFLVPIREIGVLFPQLFVAAYIRSMPLRKKVWIIGTCISAVILLLIAIITMQFTGTIAGVFLLICLTAYSFAKGLCSVSAKDIIGKTISKSRRGRLMGYSTFLAGIATLIIGLYLQQGTLPQDDLFILINFVVAAGVLNILAVFFFILINETEGATEGGGNAIKQAFKSLQLLKHDKPFQKYVIARILLLSTALVFPFYVMLIQSELNSSLSVLGLLIIISGLANSLSAPLIGRFADNNSKNVMSIASFLAAIVGILTWYKFEYYPNSAIDDVVIPIVFFLVTLSHGAIRLGRKVYLVDMANMENRAQYVAVSNTIIGIAMIVGGGIGYIADLFNIALVILILALLGLVAGIYAHNLDNVSQ